MPAQELCPVGSAVPSLGHSRTRATAERLSLVNYPDAQESRFIRGRNMQTAQFYVASSAIALYLIFVLVVAGFYVFRREWASDFLKNVDIPPIAGGPGNSPVAGYLTLNYIFEYTSFFLAHLPVLLQQRADGRLDASGLVQAF